MSQYFAFIHPCHTFETLLREIKFSKTSKCGDKDLSKIEAGSL
jgi:hypothetical protein